eukprot:gene28190-37093_t
MAITINDSSQVLTPTPPPPFAPVAFSLSISTSELTNQPLNDITKATIRIVSQGNLPPKSIRPKKTVRPTVMKATKKSTVRISRTPWEKPSVRPISAPPSRIPTATPTAATAAPSITPSNAPNKLASKSLTVRKEIRELSSAELDRYFKALWEYKNHGRRDGRPYFRNYYALVAHHAKATANSTVDQCHQHAAFVIWHSLYVRELEIALQSIDPLVAVPYWDWTIDAELPDPKKSPIFSSEYFGSSDPERHHEVWNSRMSNWTVCRQPRLYIDWESPAGLMRGSGNFNSAKVINRWIGQKGTALPERTMVEKCVLQPTSYNNFWTCVWGRPGLYQQSVLHAGVHVWAGGYWTVKDINDTLSAGAPAMGDMLDVFTSPQDPLFFSHHANLDRIFYFWRKRIGDSLATAEDPCGIFYGNDTHYPQPPGHNLNDHFSPPFYTYRANLSEIHSKGPMTLKEACRYLYTSRLPYTYTGSLPSLDSTPPSQKPVAAPSLAPLSPRDSSWPTVEPSTAYGYYAVEY